VDYKENAVFNCGRPGLDLRTPRVFIHKTLFVELAEAKCAKEGEFKNTS